ncbi:MAG: hypothetical protein Q9204_000662 [Flavoplaca sp. TL-2023a]
MRRFDREDRQLQAAEASASVARYHEQSLQQEIEQLRRNKDWLDHQLQTKTKEYSESGRDEGARISELQRQTDESATSLVTARRNGQMLRNRVDKLGQKVEEWLPAFDE